MALGTPWAHIWDDFGYSWEDLGTLLGTPRLSWGALGALWGTPGALLESKIDKKLVLKNYGIDFDTFHDLDRFWLDFGSIWDGLLMDLRCFFASKVIFK